VELHDGSTIVLKKIDKNYSPTDRAKAIGYLEHYRGKGEVVTGLLYINAALEEMHAIAGSCSTPLSQLEFDRLSPGSEALIKLQASLR